MTHLSEDEDILLTQALRQVKMFQLNKKGVE